VVIDLDQSRQSNRDPQQLCGRLELAGRRRIGNLQPTVQGSRRIAEFANEGQPQRTRLIGASETIEKCQRSFPHSEAACGSFRHQCQSIFDEFRNFNSHKFRHDDLHKPSSRDDNSP